MNTIYSKNKYIKTIYYKLYYMGCWIWRSIVAHAASIVDADQ